MKKIIIGCFLSSFLSSNFAIADVDKACNILKCNAGDKAVTYAIKSDPYYACPTKELADYTNFILGLVSVTFTLTGQLPNISDKTGEPEYKDEGGKTNETRLMIDDFRSKAKVNTFDQAVLMCSNGKSKLIVTIMNNSADGINSWVMVDKSKKTFWMPKSHLDKK